MATTAKSAKEENAPAAAAEGQVESKPAVQSGKSSKYPKDLGHGLILTGGDKKSKKRGKVTVQGFNFGTDYYPSQSVWKVFRGNPATAKMNDAVGGQIFVAFGKGAWSPSDRLPTLIAFGEGKFGVLNVSELPHLLDGKLAWKQEAKQAAVDYYSHESGKKVTLQGAFSFSPEFGTDRVAKYDANGILKAYYHREISFPAPVTVEEQLLRKAGIGVSGANAFTIWDGVATDARPKKDLEDPDTFSTWAPVNAVWLPEVSATVKFRGQGDDMRCDIFTPIMGEIKPIVYHGEQAAQIKRLKRKDMVAFVPKAIASAKQSATAS